MSSKSKTGDKSEKDDKKSSAAKEGEDTAKNAVAIAKATKEYDELVTIIANTLRAGEEMLLLHYWEMGGAFIRFNKLLDAKYGSFSADAFIADIERKSGSRLGTSTLYLAKRVTETYPRKGDIIGCAKRGLCITHLKSLFGLDEKTRLKIEARMTKPDGTIISTRELDTIVASMREKAAQKRLTTVASTPPPAPSKTEEDWFRTEPATETTVGDKAATGTEGTKDPNAGGNAPLPTPKAGEKPGPSNAKATTKTFTKSPIAVFAKGDKLLGKVVEAMADEFIAVREMHQIGYNSDIAMKKAQDALKDYQAQLKIVVETGGKLLAEIAANTPDA